MSAYVIVEIDVKNPVDYEEYRRLAPPTIAAHGGRDLVRGGPTEILEGDWSPRRMVVLEFPSAARAQAWLDSPEYGAIKHLRHQNADSRMILVEGVRPDDVFR